MADQPNVWKPWKVGRKPWRQFLTHLIRIKLDC